MQWTTVFSRRNFKVGENSGYGMLITHYSYSGLCEKEHQEDKKNT